MKFENFITNRKSIEKFSNEMTQVESDGWETKYIDKRDNSTWKKIQLDSEYHGGGSPMLYKLPKPNQSNLIKTLIASTDIDQISAISSLLKYSEFDKSDTHNEYCEELITELEKLVFAENFEWNKFQQKRMSAIINNSNLNLTHNRRESLGVTYSKVESDHQYYKDIAERAENLLNIANKSYYSVWQKFILLFK